MKAAGSQRFVLFVLAVYGVVSAAGLYHHELFLDEAHHFLVSRDSGSLADMYRNLRYDGHPRLWGALLFLVTHYVTVSPAGMQVLQWLFAMTTAFVLLQYGPFDRWTKLLILAGYYFIYEFDVLSRDYAIGIWMLFLCCHLLRRVEKHAVWIGCIAFLMCNAHLFFAFAAGAILVYLLAAGFWVGSVVPGGSSGSRPTKAGRRLRARYAAMMVLIVLGLAAALIQE